MRLRDVYLCKQGYKHPLPVTKILTQIKKIPLVDIMCLRCKDNCMETLARSYSHFQLQRVVT